MGISIDEFLGKQAAEVVVEAARGNEPLAWNLPIEHWSASSLSLFMDCEYKWQQKYLRGISEPTGEALLIGRAVHVGLERNFGWKIDAHEDIPLHELLQWYDDYGFTTVLETEQERYGDVVWDTDPEKAALRGRSMLAEYHKQVAPRIQPLAVEQKFETWEFGLAVPIQGYIDVEEETTVIDFKSGKRRRDKPKGSWKIQATVYGEATAGKAVEFHTITSTDAGKVSVLTPLESPALLLAPGPQERQEIGRTVRALSAYACFLMDTYGVEIDWPTTGKFHDWLCDYCGLRGGCPAWREP